VAAPPALLIEAMRDTDKVVEWNKTLLQSKLLKRINDDFSITYQVKTICSLVHKNKFKKPNRIKKTKQHPTTTKNDKLLKRINDDFSITYQVSH